MMIFSNPTVCSLLFFCFLSTALFKLSYSIRNTTVIFCPEIEKKSLLSFKNSLKDPYKLLSSWDSDVNCCNWNGVSCNSLSGHVHQLNLHGQFDYNNHEIQGLSGKMNPSLLYLKHLSYLNLSLHSFDETIPSFIGLFSELKYLELSKAGFHGQIPHEIGNLSSLRSLVLACDENYRIQLDSDNLEWLSRLSKLENLSMHYADLSEATNWAQVIYTLPSLIRLNLGSCSLDFFAPLNDHVNTTSLTFINLSENNIMSSAILRWILQLSNLAFLDLSLNNFEGPIPTYCNASKLQHINLSNNNLNFSIPDWLYLSKDIEFVDLSHNRLDGTISSSVANLTSLSYFNLENNLLSGKIPREIASLCKIQSLHLAWNELQGEIFDLLENVPKCFSQVLQDLSLRGNQIYGHLTDQIAEFKSLVDLDLGNNLLSGAIPENLGKLMSLVILVLDDNKFIGNLPESLGQLCNLEDIFIGYNMLEGGVTKIHFVNLTKLSSFSASSNHLTLNVSPNWNPPFQLRRLDLASWNLAGFGSKAPSWLVNQKNILKLDLSNTGISFNVPSSFWDIGTLNLSHNALHGQIPYLRGDAEHGQLVYLSSNQFSGLLLRVGGLVRELDLSNNSFSGGMSHFLCDKTFETYDLRILHVGGNQLSGEIPDCWMRWPYMRYLNLGNNNISGRIPHSIGYLRYLLSLNLYNNSFSGPIPVSLHNCSALVKIDFGNNDLDGSIPPWVGSNLINLKFLILRANKLSGNISSRICCLNSLQILDLSGNKISGIIPSCVYNLTAMATKTLSLVDDYGDSDRGYSLLGDYFFESVYVGTKGGLLEYDTILPLVTNIDLSKNNLSGDIPKELTSLVELRSLNLSHNQLTGVIPDGIGDMKQMESLDLSLNSLSGQIPNRLALLSSLAYLNLSFNKLNGKIPEGTQISGFNASSFIGNNLCGPPLTRNCSHDGDQAHEHEEETQGDHKPEIEWLYVLLSLGFAVGFSGVCTALVLKKPWRDAYFGLLECIWDKIYVFVAVQWIRLSKPAHTK